MVKYAPREVIDQIAKNFLAEMKITGEIGYSDGLPRAFDPECLSVTDEGFGIGAQEDVEMRKGVQHHLGTSRVTYEAINTLKKLLENEGFVRRKARKPWLYCRKVYRELGPISSKIAQIFPALGKRQEYVKFTYDASIQ